MRGAPRPLPLLLGGLTSISRLLLCRCTAPLPRFPAFPPSFFRPRHHRPELGTDPLDLMIPVRLTQALEVGASSAVLSQPLAGKRAILHRLQNLPHGCPGLIGDHPGSPGVVAV